jgi:hypothetical protein
MVEMVEVMAETVETAAAMAEMVEVMAETVEVAAEMVTAGELIAEPRLRSRSITRM